mmetsp:Transcript_19532/g.49847  ORF Transcript_19532/g.49847 Transcript_19532/m.49847 type:complete len:549 (+) Transcript_19532:861-2507(+)
MRHRIWVRDDPATAEGHVAAMDAGECGAHRSLASGRAMCDALSEAKFLTTCPMWLAADGSEVVPAWIAHETMLKPEDAHLQYSGAAPGRSGLTHAEVVSLLRDDDDPHDPRPTEQQQQRLYNMLRGTPVFTLLYEDLLGQLCNEEPTSSSEQLALLMWITVLSANSQNDAGAEAMVCARGHELRGRFVNYHVPQWLQSVANRLHLPSKIGVTCTDSIPLSFKEWNFDEVKACVPRAAAYLLWLYGDVNKLLFKHVKHPRTCLHNDCASDVKFLTFGYEVGWLPQRPLIIDVWKEFISDNTVRCALVPHSLCHVDMIFWGVVRTAQSFRSKKCKFDSDTKGRLNAACWVALGWHGCMVTGGLMPPGVAGGSAQGKAPTPSDVQSEDKAVVYEARRQKAAAALADPEVRLEMQRSGTLRSVFPDWVQVMKLQACDFAAVVAMVYRYSTPKRLAPGVAFGTRRTAPNNQRTLWHVCGAADIQPMWPADVAALHSAWLPKSVSGRFMCDPPASLWKKGGTPQFPNDADQVMALMGWWERARVSPEVYQLRIS